GFSDYITAKARTQKTLAVLFFRIVNYNINMRLQFLYSKNKEKEKLLNIYDEYQWFIDNDFPIILPKFYAKIYQNNKKLFVKKLNRELNKVYNKDNYQFKKEIIKNNWQKIEKKFFKILSSFNFKIKDKYFCYISLYGPKGQFNYPNIVNLRVVNCKDIKNANEIIAHEIIHLLIYNKVRKLKLNYEQIEGLVDLFFIETKLKDIFPKYEIQNVGVTNKKLFYNIIKIKNSPK
ncbi:MAG: hypothetical protein PHO28_00840, partial [Candidatus Pacebacteria bacterium]|nr:hypothetical protein [Candidatus Paceibacterota bacterium]